MEFLALPYTAFLFIADLFFAAIKKREPRLWHLIWVSMLILPVFYAFSTFLWNGHFSGGEFTPNIGLGLVLLQLGFISAIEALERLPLQQWGNLIEGGVVGVAVFFTISFTSLTDFSVNVFRDAKALFLVGFFGP